MNLKYLDEKEKSARDYAMHFVRNTTINKKQIVHTIAATTKSHKTAIIRTFNKMQL